MFCCFGSRKDRQPEKATEKEKNGSAPQEPVPTSTGKTRASIPPGPAEPAERND